MAKIKLDTKYKIIQDHEKCISCGGCIAASKNWKWGKDGKAIPKKAIIPLKEYADNKKAEDACPISIISIERIE